MIQHDLNSTKMVPTMTDAVCPQCRHVFPLQSPSQSIVTKNHFHHSVNELSFTDLCPNASTHSSSSSNSSNDTPPEPPPRLKPTIYANIPQSISPSSSNKSYVTMSNLNLSTNTSNPTFVPTSPTTSSNSIFGKRKPLLLPVINTPASRVYRQLSGGGLVDNDGMQRIHELQPRHQMCGGGLISMNEDTPSSSLPDSNKILISRNNICISSPCSTSNISILVPTSVNTSLEISSDSINISLPIIRNKLRRNQSTRRYNVPNSVLYPLETISDLAKQSHKVPVDDIQCLTRTVQCLKESGWFHEGLSWNESETLLTGSDNGTFIVRESSNSNFLYAITVQTEQEPTSVRIQYNNGRFRLDCVSHVTPIVPQFDCVVDLIEYYVTEYNPNQNQTNVNCVSSSLFTLSNNNILGNQVFVDEYGHINSVVSLKKPLRCTVPSLMHSARLSINKQLKKTHFYSKQHLSPILDSLDLPKSLKLYLFQYPYSL